MALQCEEKDGKLVCKFEGRMDTIKCQETESEVMDKVEGHDGQVVFDLGGVDYIASSFLRLCGKVANKVKSENMSIINVTPPVKKVFKISGLATKLNIS